MSSAIRPPLVPVAGHPIHDVHIELYGGSYHDVDSTQDAFRVAGYLATESDVRQAGPIVVEPMMLVDAVIPVECLGDVARDFDSRGGQLRAQEDRGETVVIRALVPMAKLWGYAADLRSRTRGRGSSTMQFEEYAPLPSTDDADDRARWCVHIEAGADARPSGDRPPGAGR